jgi:hypothetical protein
MSTPLAITLLITFISVLIIAIGIDIAEGSKNE